MVKRNVITLQYPETTEHTGNEERKEKKVKNDDTHSINILHTYTKSLSEELRTSDKVTRHPELKSDRWTKTRYEILADVIAEDLNERLSPKQRMTLGTSLSSRTLRKIILAEYKITRPIDPRTLNTLNKVVIFIGYDSWDHFVNEVDRNAKPEYKEETDTKQEVIDVVKEAVHNEFHTYYNLPDMTEKVLTKTHIKNGPSFNYVMDFFTEKKDRKLIISNRFNPSTYEILDIVVKKLEDAYAQVYTKEYWLLCWWDPQKNRYIQRYKNISDHFYILKKINGRWKVKTNATTADPMEINTNTP